MAALPAQQRAAAAGPSGAQRSPYGASRRRRLETDDRLRLRHVSAAAAAAAAATPLDAEEAAEAREQELTPLKMLRFALPTLVLPLADPLMSLIDTLCISAYSTALDLAAAGPAALLFNASSSLFSALTATALAAMSRALARDRASKACRAFGDAVAAALVAGLVVGGIFVAFSQQLVGALGVAPDVLPVAARYLSIRAFAAPASNLIAVCSAALLAQQDSRSPSLVVLASATFNFGTDIVIIAMLRYGLVGAAYGTVLTQYLTLAALLAICARPDRLSPDLSRFLPWLRRKRDAARSAARVAKDEIERRWRDAVPRVVRRARLAVSSDNGSSSSSGDDAASASDDERPAPPPAPVMASRAMLVPPGAVVEAAGVESAVLAAQSPPPPPPAPPAMPAAQAVANGTGSDSDAVYASRSLGALKQQLAMAAVDAADETSVSEEDDEGTPDEHWPPPADNAALGLGAFASPPGGGGASALVLASTLSSGDLGRRALYESASEDEEPVDAWASSTREGERYSLSRAEGSYVGSVVSEASEAEDGDGGGAGGLVLTAVYAAKLVCYFTVQGSAMRLSVLALAAHNCMFSVWNVCAFFPVPIQTTALAFLPSCSSVTASKRLVRLLYSAALCLALPLALCCWALPALAPGAISSDPRVAGTLPTLAVPAALSILFCTVDVAGEAVLVAQQRMAVLLGSMVLVLAAVVFYFWRGGGGGLAGTWGGLLLFFGFRCTLSSIVVFVQQWRL